MNTTRSTTVVTGDVGNDATEEDEFVSDWHPDIDNPKLHMEASTVAPCVHY